MEIAPQLPHCPNFGPKKQFPVWVLRRHEMTCASELKPHIHNNDDPWEKIHHYKYWNSLDRYPIGIFAMYLLYREFQYLKWWFFSWIFIIMYMRLKFWSTCYFMPSKYLYWKLLFWAKISTICELWEGILRVPIFISQIIIMS